MPKATRESTRRSAQPYQTHDSDGVIELSDSESDDKKAQEAVLPSIDKQTRIRIQNATRILPAVRRVVYRSWGLEPLVYRTFGPVEPVNVGAKLR